jgi:hypothetical protein
MSALQPAGSGWLLGCGAGGARRLRQHHTLHSAGRRPAAGSGPLLGCCARRARRPQLHHLLHSAGRRSAAGSGRLLGCCTREGSSAPTTPSFAICGPPSGSRLRPVAGLRTWGLAGFYYTVCCTLRAAVRQPISTGCWAAARGGSPASTTPSSALCWPPSGSRLRPVAGLQHVCTEGGRGGGEEREGEDLCKPVQSRKASLRRYLVPMRHWNSSAPLQIQTPHSPSKCYFEYSPGQLNFRL